MHVSLCIADGSKRSLLADLGIDCDKNELVVSAAPQNIDTLLLAARVHCLSKVEKYFLQSKNDLLRPLNVRNEAAAISFLLAQLRDAEDDDARALVEELSTHSQVLWPELAWGDINLGGRSPPAASYPDAAAGPATEFERWAGGKGVKAAIRLAAFGELRGCAAARDLCPGDLILSIPESALVYEDTVKKTDLGRMLMAIPDLSTDSMLIIFTMIDRHDPDSAWNPLWASLPEAYYTGLSFPPDLVAELAGTAAQLELVKAQAHLAAQYRATRPLLDMLLAAYPGDIKASWFDYPSYLWAVELWYAYAFEVEFPGRPGPPSVPVMVPFACHVNHSPWPHVVRYGRADPHTRTLDFPAFRPCGRGQQVYISYGPVPNLKLLCYYGFVIPNNPHDLVPLELEAPGGELSMAQRDALARHHLTLDHSLQQGPLSLQLLACIRILVATPEELEAVVQSGVDPLQRQLSPENEEQALATLEAALVSLLAPLRTSPLLPPPTPPGPKTPDCPPPADAPQQGVGQGASSDARSCDGAAAEGAPQGGGRDGGAGGGGAGAGEGGELNENGLDDSWVGSRGFCREYVRGQVAILERALEEVRKLAGS